MIQPVLIKTSLVAITIFLSAEAGLACMYGPPYRTVCDTYARADSVIVGKIESVDGFGTNLQTVVLTVLRTYKGPPRKQIVLSQPQSSCDWDFSGSIGKTMLLYLVRDKKTKKYSALAQGMGGPVDQESENLYWLNKLPRSRNRTRISGTVNVYREEPFEFIEHVQGLKIRVFSETKSFDVVTDRYGVYELWDVPVGKYQIVPVIPSLLKLRFPLERGAVDFDSLKKKNPNSREVLIEIQPRWCGGLDFVLNKKA